MACLSRKGKKENIIFSKNMPLAEAKPRYRERKKTNVFYKKMYPKAMKKSENNHLKSWEHYDKIKSEKTFNVTAAKSTSSDALLAHTK